MSEHPLSGSPSHLFFSRPLPLDLLPRVALHLANTSQPISQTTLARIARCSKKLYLIAQPLLYSTFYLDDESSAYLLDNFITLDRVYDGGADFPPYMFETFHDLHPIDMPPHLRILYNLWNVRTLVIKTTPYGQGTSHFARMVERLSADHITLLPKLKRIVIARSALERISRAEKVGKRLGSELISSLSLASRPAYLCVDIPSKPPRDFTLDEREPGAGPSFRFLSRSNLIIDISEMKGLKQSTCHLHSDITAPIAIRGALNNLCFEDDYLSEQAFVFNDEDDDGRESDIFLQSAAVKVVEQIRLSITQAIDPRPQVVPIPTWIPTAPTEPPPDDASPLSESRRQWFAQRFPNSVDPAPEAQAAVTGPGTSDPRLSDGPPTTQTIGNTGLTDDDQSTSTEEDDDEPEQDLSGTSFVIWLPGWILVEPIESIIKEWLEERYSCSHDVQTLEQLVTFVSRGSVKAQCGACDRDL